MTESIIHIKFIILALKTLFLCRGSCHIVLVFGHMSVKNVCHTLLILLTGR